MRARTVYEFADVRVDLGRMTASRAGVAIPLEPKAFDVLAYLLEHRDRLIGKEELLDKVWAGTFVTPNVLTRAVAQIRKALGDESQDARYIETVAKRGYRFVAPVTVSEPDANPIEQPPPAPVSPPAVVTPPSPIPHRSWLPAVAAGVVLVLVAAAALLYIRQRREPAAVTRGDVRLKRLTNRRGFNGTPGISPDGRAIVYASDQGGALELYLASLAAGVAEVQLTHDGGHNVQPAWSPDGQWIAFHSEKRHGIWIIPATGGAAQQIVEFGSDPAWSPDSSQLVFTSDAAGFVSQSSLWLVNRDGSGRKELTRVGTPSGGHRAPAWSHDGRVIAFIVSRGGWSPQIWTLSVDTGEQHLVETTTSGADPCFSPSDRALLWGGSTGVGNARLFSRALDENGVPIGKTETVFPFDAGAVASVSVAANGTVAFASRTVDANLWAVDVDAAGRGGTPVRLTDAVARTTHPDYSNDGRVAYQELAVGVLSTLWTINDDGSGRASLIPGTPGVDPQWDLAHNRVFLTRVEDSQKAQFAWLDLGSRRLTPIDLRHEDGARLSPDGEAVAYHHIEQDGRMSVWTARFDGTRHLVASDSEAVSYPAWSRDGKWLAVELKRGDTTHLGIVPSGGGPVVQLTNALGQSWPHSWAPDNDRIAFAGERDGVWNIYSVSRSTRAITQLTSFTSAAGYVRYPAWSPRGSRIVFERSLDDASVWTATLPPELDAPK